MMYPNPLRSIIIITFTITTFFIHLATAAQEIQWGVLSAKDVTQMGPFELTEGWYELRVEFISGRLVGFQRNCRQNCHRSAVFNMEHFAYADISS